MGIGEAAAKAGVSVQAIRYYERRGKAFLGEAMLTAGRHA